MIRLITTILAALLVSGLGSAAASAASVQSTPTQETQGRSLVAQGTSTMTNTPPMEFGSPPTGAIPILYNDHHVYSKPDVLKHGRVLSALVKGHTILVPLRSMFEQMGATVSYNANTKTVTVSKPGAEVKVTLGKPEVVINGEPRPLDVPPMEYQGQILVPIRVISEGMGAYVQWEQSRHLVVVRYAPVVPTPAPTEAPTEAPAPPPPPTPQPTIAPTPTPAPAAVSPFEHFVAADYIFGGKTYNEFSPGNSDSKGSYAVRGAVEFPAFGLPWMVEGDFRQYAYDHHQNSATPVLCPSPGEQGCVTVIGGYGQTFVPAFTARDYDVEGRLGLKVADPRIYVGVAWMNRTTNYGYPRQDGFGFGAEKLPDLNQPFSVYGSVYYYPNVKGNFTVPGCPAGATPGTPACPDPNAGSSLTLGYHIVTYQIGGTYNFGSSPVFLDFGFLGDRGTNKTNAPGDFSHNGAYVGLGVRF
ncbi:copper amine oxidase N-terminal domain-containing protein [bacterium]|nr:MAG: copper amine oxidase N-terminal domain-containing protein [bacterium]